MSPIVAFLFFVLIVAVVVIAVVVAAILCVATLSTVGCGVLLLYFVVSWVSETIDGPEAEAEPD